MMFLKKYLQATNYLPTESTHPIVGYCDNLGLIQLVTAMQTNKIPNPSQAISNDYDLTNKIFQMILCLPVTITLSHIKGHQDNNTPTEELPYPAQLNITCDERARSALATLPINVQPHPALPSAYPQLQIWNQVIVWQLPEYMQEAARLPAYKQYLATKYHWSPQVPSTIEWTIIEFTM